MQITKKLLPLPQERCLGSRSAVKGKRETGASPVQTRYCESQ